MGEPKLCDECGEHVVYATKGVDGPNRWYHADTGRAFCYRAPEHTETARPA
jgi:hypothetical protein